MVGAARPIPTPVGLPTAPWAVSPAATTPSVHAGQSRPCQRTGQDGTAQPAEARRRRHSAKPSSGSQLASSQEASSARIASAVTVLGAAVSVGSAISRGYGTGPTVGVGVERGFVVCAGWFVVCARWFVVCARWCVIDGMTTIGCFEPASETRKLARIQPGQTGVWLDISAQTKEEARSRVTPRVPHTESIASDKDLVECDSRQAIWYGSG